MSKFQQARIRTFTAESDLRLKKYFGLKIGATAGGVDLAGAGDAEFILMNEPNIGDQAECAMIGGGAQVHSGAAIAYGDEFASDAAGKIIPAVSTNKVIGIALASASGADEYVEIERVRYVKA